MADACPLSSPSPPPPPPPPLAPRLPRSFLGVDPGLPEGKERLSRSNTRESHLREKGMALASGEKVCWVCVVVVGGVGGGGVGMRGRVGACGWEDGGVGRPCIRVVWCAQLCRTGL